MVLYAIMKIISKGLSLLLLLSAVSCLLAAGLSGCSSVHNAREVQAELSAKGCDCAVLCATSRVDLRSATLADLVGFALTNRPSIAQKVLAVDDARQQMREIASTAPVLSETPWTALKATLSGSHSESTEAMRRNDANWHTDGGASALVSLDLLLWDFGSYDARASAQAEQVVAAELELQSEVFAVCRETAVAWFNFLEQRALLGVAMTNEVQYADHLASAQARFDAGEVNKLDVLKARLDLAAARQKVVAVSNGVDTTGAALMQALGIDASRGTVAEVVGAGSLPVNSVRRGFATTTETVGEAFAFARTNAPAVRVARARLRAAAHNVDYAIANLMPSVSASASLRWADPFWYWSWGFSAVQSLYEGGRKVTAVDRAVIALEEASVGVDDVEQRLSLALETAVANRDNAKEALVSAQASIRSARENLETVREQFAIGSSDRIELSDAIASDSRARGDCISAFYDGQRAEAALFEILGVPPMFTEELVKGDVK